MNLYLLTYLCCLPTLFYLVVVLLTIPINTVKLKYVSKFMFFGILSVFFTKTFAGLFPTFFYINYFGIFEEFQIDVIFYRSFIQIALVEEFFKIIVFLLICKFINEKFTPLSTMIYFGIVGLSFGLLENFYYVAMFGGNVLKVRFFTATLLHLTVGFIGGFCIAMKDVHISMGGRSYIGLFLEKHKAIKDFYYVLFSLCMCTFIHGLYDFNIFIGSINMWPMLLTQVSFLVFLSYVAAKYLIYKKS